MHYSTHQKQNPSSELGRCVVGSLLRKICVVSNCQLLTHNLRVILNCGEYKAIKLGLYYKGQFNKIISTQRQLVQFLIV
ncbi:hypothetical protein FGO68_gene15022 [Halteria grandinella]|uniref:Uncharacterized protein n=1 Tax=Halteria grandinella TaxID=5974 RepID=A0A8J8NR97_HALGN|nr:hypothetical protein FGO68_gene15022 [Halteria grandinella]